MAEYRPQYDAWELNSTWRRCRAAERSTCGRGYHFAQHCFYGVSKTLCKNLHAKGMRMAKKKTGRILCMAIVLCSKLYLFLCVFIYYFCLSRLFVI